jgi:glycosyltransferase involved in cell wall biosynthesis
MNIKETEHKPISIGYDAKRAFYNKSGLGNYSRSLISAIIKNYPGNSFFLFTPKTKKRAVLEYEDKFRLIEPKSFFNKLVNAIWRIKFVNRDIVRNEIKIYHGLSQELPFGIEKTGTKTVVTVHDLIFLRFPEFYKWVDIKIYTWKVAHACKVADHIVAISLQTRNDLIEFLGISPDKISVIYQGCNPLFWKTYSNEFHQEIRMKFNLPEKYLLYVGTIEERKNLLGIIKAIHAKNINIPLVVIGRKTDLYYKSILDYLSANNLSNIIFLQGVSNTDLPVIYQNAECFIYPSFYEGFGIPLIEALVSKIPVITSINGCFAEAAGPGSIYVDPYDVEKLGDAIVEVLQSNNLRDKMIEIGTDFVKKFKDDLIAEKYINLYYSLLKEGN